MDREEEEQEEKEEEDTEKCGIRKHFTPRAAAVTEASPIPRASMRRFMHCNPQVDTGYPYRPPDMQ